MRAITIAIAAIIAAAGFAPAWAQDDDAPAAKGKPSPTEMRAKAAELAKTRAEAMKDTPALIQQAGLTCTVTDAASQGAGKTDVNGKKVASKFYEVACSDAPGYIIIAAQGATPQAFDCLAMSTSASGLKCALPANAEPYKGLQPLITKANVQCSVTKGRWIGASPTDKVDQYEVGCADGSAYILVSPQAGSAKTLTAENCSLAALSGGQACTYFTKAQAVQSMSRLAAAANRGACQVSDARYLGEAPATHEVYYEIGCADNKSGYVLELTAANQFKAAIDCGKASQIGGGCQLTSVDVAETEEASTYTKAAGDAGFPCQVTKYHSIGLDPASKREIVELACSGRGDPVIAFLPVDKGQTLDVWNCARAAARGVKCGLAPISATYAAMSQQASAKGKSCQVSDTRSVGTSPTGSDYVEAACTGGPGLMFEYGSGKETLKSVMTCAEAKGIGGGCKIGK